MVLKILLRNWTHCFLKDENTHIHLALKKFNDICCPSDISITDFFVKFYYLSNKLYFLFFNIHLQERVQAFFVVDNSKCV